MKKYALCTNNGLEYFTKICVDGKVYFMGADLASKEFNNCLEEDLTMENNVNNGTNFEQQAMMDGYRDLTSPVVEHLMNDIPNGTFQQPVTVPCDGEKLDSYEYAQKRGMNKEFYKDPTYHAARRRNDGYFDNRQRRMDRPHDSVPVYFSSRSKRFELVGIIMRLCDIAGFELAERIVLKDKETGEIYR